VSTPDNEPFSSRPIRRVLWIVLGLNLAVAIAKLVVGWLTGSISMVADGFHSTTDSASNVVGLIGVSLAALPPDENHPYGHRKIETLSALAIGGLLAMTAWEVLRSCLQRLWRGGAPEVEPQSFGVMIATLCVNLAVSAWERRRGEALGSEVLRADAAHTRSDVYVSLGVIASLIAVKLGYPQVDVVAALVITVVIANVAFQILRQSAGMLVDPAVVPAERVREVALSVPGVEGVHKVRTRGHPQSGHADLHVQVRPDLRLDQAHVIGHLVTDRLREEFGFRDVVTHVEPPPGHRTDWRPEVKA
jgi:cation diffusion facilitator family transporter